MSDLEFSDSDTEDLTNNNMLKLLFNKAADHVQHTHGKITQDMLLQLYAYYKQVQIGKCNATKPSLFQVQARAKWHAWNSLSDMPKFEAMQHYVKLLEKIDPIWHKEICNELTQHNEQNKNPFIGWVVHSTLQQTNETIDESNKNPFDYVREGNLDELRKYITAQHADLATALLQEKDANGMGLVHWASDRNQPHILEYLLQNGANVNLRDKEGQTPLHYAACCGHHECIAILLKNNADCLIGDADKNTCIEVALDAETRSMLLKH